MFPTIIDYLFPIKSTNRKELSVCLYNYTQHKLTELWKVKSTQWKSRTLRPSSFPSIKNTSVDTMLFHEQNGFQLYMLLYIPFEFSLFLLFQP